MNKMTKKISVFMLVCLSIISCKKEENTGGNIGTYLESGSAIVVNEGNFGSSNGSVSYIDRNGVATNFIYENANNGINLGDVIQSYTTVGTKGIICVNNSFKIEIVDARTFKRLATITDTTATQNTSYVRSALAINDNKAYVTNSICGPSRATILTGKYSHKNGFKDNEHSSFDGSQNTFIKELTNAGYQTAWIGKWHLETEPQGFSYWQVLPGQGSYYNPDFL